MAKKSVRTNAFGMTPDSFDTTKMKQETEENTVSATPEAHVAPVAATPTPVAAAPVNVSPAVAPEQGKREYKKIGKDKVRVHFLAKAHLLERVDTCAEAKDLSRTIVIQEAIREYLEREGY